MEQESLDLVVENEESRKKEVRQYLKMILVDVRRLLNVALIFASLSVVFIIIQSWFIANLFSHLLLVTLNKTVINFSFCFQSLLIIIICYLIKPLFQYIRERCSQKASFITRQKIQRKLIQIISELGPESRIYGSEGALSSKLIEQVDALDGYISRYYVQFMLVVITPVLILFAIVQYSWVATAIFILTAPLVIIFMILVGASAANKSRKQFDALSQLSGRFLDLLRGMKTITHFNASDRAEKIIEDSAEEYRIGTMSVLKIAFLSIGVLEIFSSLCIALVAVYLGLGLMGEFPLTNGMIIVPYQAALFILLLAPEFYAPLRALGSEYHAKASAEGAVESLMPILSKQAWVHPGDKIIDFVNAPQIEVKDLAIIAPNGGFRLSPLNFLVHSGKRVLIKGASGVGKSSLFEAILGFIPYNGSIFIDNIDLQEIDRDNWHKYIGYLSQSPRMMSGTIASNLRLALPDATNDQLWDVLAQVELYDLVKSLPKQLATPLGEKGLGLSGGQLGRLAIAQLLLQGGVLWLLDEPTEHLDPDTADIILRLLDKVTKNRTVLLISHQEHSLDWLDKKILIE